MLNLTPTLILSPDPIWKRSSDRAACTWDVFCERGHIVARVIPYAATPEFEDLLLEESRITKISGSDGSLKIEAEVALLGDHKLYSVPLPGEIHCFGRVRMSANGQVSWLVDRRDERTTDEDGLRHLGNFTRFESVDGVWYLEGPWGAVQIRKARWKVNAR